MTSSPNRNTSRSGLSLIELLITVAVIAIAASAAISSLTGVTEGVAASSSRRSAQIVASTAESALSAGSPQIATATTAKDVIEMLDSGVEGEGVFEGVMFKVRLNEEERVKVLPYLKFDSDSGLYYDPDSID